MKLLIGAKVGLRKEKCADATQAAQIYDSKNRSFVLPKKMVSAAGLELVRIDYNDRCTAPQTGAIGGARVNWRSARASQAVFELTI